MKEDFFVTVSDASGGEETMLIWVPLAILAHNVVMEHGGSQQVCRKASLAVINHGKDIDYEQQRLTVGRQVIMAARKAADAVIEELGNGDVAAAVLAAVRVGGEILTSAKATGVVIDAMATQGPEADSIGGDNGRASSSLIHIALTKPMGIVFEPVGAAHECGVRIRELTRSGKAFLSEALKVGDELLSINDKKVSHMPFYEVVNFMSDEDDKKQFTFIFRRQNKKEMKAAMGLRFRNLFKRGATLKDNQIAEQREDDAPSREIEDLSLPPANPNVAKITKGNQIAEQRREDAFPRDINNMSSPALVKPNAMKRVGSSKGNQIAEQRREDAFPRDINKVSSPALEKPNAMKRVGSSKGNQIAEQRREDAFPRDINKVSSPALEKLNAMKRVGSSKGNQIAEQRREDAFPRDINKVSSPALEKPNAMKRVGSSKGNQIAEQRREDAFPRDINKVSSPALEKPSAMKRVGSSKGNGLAETRHNDNRSHEVNKVSSPALLPETSGMHHTSDHSIASCVSSHGSSYFSDVSSLGLFGLWRSPLSRKSKGTDLYPSRFVTGCESVATTLTDADQSSLPLLDFDLSKLFGFSITSFLRGDWNRSSDDRNGSFDDQPSSVASDQPSSVASRSLGDNSIVTGSYSDDDNDDDSPNDSHGQSKGANKVLPFNKFHRKRYVM